jgi:hypothetical protein
MVANPLDVFRALNYGFTPGTLISLTKAGSYELADQAQLCTAAFIPGPTDPDRTHLPLEPVKNSVLPMLTAVVERIVDAEVLEAIAQVIYWMNTMHFAAAIMRCVSTLALHYPTC